jgi:hypothetical protein
MKQRYINFYYLIKKTWRSDEETHCDGILEYLRAILNIDVKERFHDIYSSQKFFYLSHAQLERNSNIIKFSFTSAKNQYRADLIDKETGIKRTNPKTLTEGEEEITHGVIQFEQTETKLILERNGNGISINNIIDYLNAFYKRIYDVRNFSFGYNTLLRVDFLEHVNRLARVTLAKAYVNKSILGGDTLNFSSRTANVKRELVIQVNAKKSESIKETAIDIYNKIANGGSAVNRVLIQGHDEFKHQVTLDSLEFYKKETASFETNIRTGVIISANAYTVLKRFLTQFD